MHSKVDRWLLPDGIEEMLPLQAKQMESLRRELLDLFERWGYDYVIPPMLEFTDSLLTGTGQDIDLLTFKLTDQLSGRTLGLRADITPQVARMDAHSLKREGINRLCYAGHVIHTIPKSPLSSRSPVKVGVELFGAAGVDAEIELVSLLLATLDLAKLERQYVDIGHVAIFRSLAKCAQLTQEQVSRLFSLLQSKALSDIDDWLAKNLDDEQITSWFAALPRLAGGGGVIDQAREIFVAAPDEVQCALNELQVLRDTVSQRFPAAELYFDLSELRGYQYHTGVVFGAFSPGAGNAIARGGRYDRVGEAFGRARSAVGFDVNLSAICRLQPASDGLPRGVFARAVDSAAWWAEVERLRAEGVRVVVGVDGQEKPFAYQNCDQTLVDLDDRFVLQPNNV